MGSALQSVRRKCTVFRAYANNVRRRVTIVLIPRHVPVVKMTRFCWLAVRNVSKARFVPWGTLSWRINSSAIVSVPQGTII